MSPPTRRGPGGGSPDLVNIDTDGIDNSESTAAGSNQATTLSVTTWAEKIRPHMAQAVESILETGRLLNAAKAELAHGEFGPLLEELGIGERMAQRFMRIATHPVLANPSRVSDLPSAVGVLDALSRVEEVDLERALDRGEVGPGTTRSEAEDLARRVPDPVVSAMAEAVAALDSFCDAHHAPVQARDHALDLACIVGVASVHSADTGDLGEQMTDPEFLQFVETVWPDLVTVPGWRVAMFWIGCEALFTDTSRVRISRPFTEQLLERTDGADDLEAAAAAFLGSDVEVSR